MKPTLFLLGPSDNATQNPATREWVDGVGWKVSADLAGVLPILPFIEQDDALSANSHRVLVGLQDLELELPRVFNVFNLVGDADASPRLLRQIDNIAEQLRPHRLFNPPANVLATSRRHLSATLANIPDCVIPRTEAADPRNIDELREACRHFDCWPVIIRARGYHGGQRVALIADESELESLQQQPWVYGGVFLIEFVDCRSSDGLYHKMRVMMVDGEPYARQCVYSDQWLIRSGSRADVMHGDASLREREEIVLSQLQAGGLHERRSLFGEINRRIGLDMFGIDFALVGERMVIFEANACMHALGKSKHSPPEYRYLVAYKMSVRRALKKMLLNA